jgi:hypothetical protein
MDWIVQNINTTLNNIENIRISEGLNIKFVSSQYAELVRQWAKMFPLLNVGAKFI